MSEEHKPEVYLKRIAEDMKIVRTKPASKELFKGRGYSAPKATSTSHHRSGSQGKHGGK